MGNTDLHQFPNEGSKLKNPPSPKLVVSGSMSQSKTTTGSPKSPKMLDDGSKSDGASTSLSKTVRSSPSSTKSSPGSNNKTLSLAEKLALSTRGKSNPALKSPVSKTPPVNLTNLTTSKTDLSKEPEKQQSTDQCMKSDEPEKIKGFDNFEEIQSENIQISNEKDLVTIENETSVSNEVKEDKEDICLESNEIEVQEFTKADLNEVVTIQSSDDLTKPLRIDDNIILELTSKKDIRQKVWKFLEENSLVVFPKPCFNRIPNFKGCPNATQSLEKLDEFKKAKTIQVTPDKAQETARFITLNWGKRLLVPLLRLKEGLLQNVSLPFPEPSINDLKLASTQKGLRRWGHKLITMDQNNEGYHIDMIILGSVAVDRKGCRIGIGDGFCDLEYVILNSMNMVSDNTVIVTIVHDSQVFNTLPSEIFKPYDVPVDIIITSTEIIRVETRLDRPKDVLWNYISKRRLLEMPPLQLLRTKQEKDNDDIDCTLKDVDSEPEEIPPSSKIYKSYKKSKGYRQKRSYSTRSETNDSVFKDTDVSKNHFTSKQSTKKSDGKVKPNKRAKSTSNRQNRNNSTSRPNNQQNDQKEQRSSSKKPNKRRTKSESAKTVTSPALDSKNSDTLVADTPSLDTPKNKRRSQQKQRQQPVVLSDDNDKTLRPSNTKVQNYTKNKSQQSRSSSRATRRDYIDHQDHNRDMSVGHMASREYKQSPRKYYSQNRYNSYSQDRPVSRSNSQEHHRDSSRSAPMHQNRYSNGPAPRQSRYFNGPTSHHNGFNGSTSRHNSFNGSMSRHNSFSGSTSRHNSFNGPSSRHNGGNMNHNAIRHNSFSNSSLSHQNSYYDEGVNNHRNSFSKGSIRQEGYTNSRVFRPPRYVNVMAPQTIHLPTNGRDDYVRESRSRFNSTRSTGYFNPNEKPNYSRSFSGDEFVLKVGNIANNVRVRDLKAALMERGVKPLHITWRGPRGFAYLRYSNSNDINKDNVMGSLHNVRIKPNGVETSQTQTLIVTECQLS